MTDFLRQAAARRTEDLKRAVFRRRLVFVQMGSAFEPMREAILGGMPGGRTNAKDLLKAPEGTLAEPSILVTSVEEFVSAGWSVNGGLGALREIISARVDSGQDVCLVSRAPRVAFGNIPGSSVLDDAALVTLALLSADECPDGAGQAVGWKLPSVTYGDCPEIIEAFVEILGELGFGVLTALDHALYELDPRSAEGLRFLPKRDLEALRGAGLVEVGVAGAVSLTVPRRLTQLKDALADLLGQATTPPVEYASVADGLWYLERTVRAAVRARAIAESGARWRGAIVSEGMAAEVLKRAQLDANPTAVSIRELRDPLEWLTLGELLDIAQSGHSNQLQMDAVLWRRLSEQVVPVRNRVSHMRYLKSSDPELVMMWVGIVRQHLERSPKT